MGTGSVVTLLPLNRLWDDEGEIEAIRQRSLSKESLREVLRQSPVEFIVADVGIPLKRIAVETCYAFWKSDVMSHIVADPESGFRIDEFPGHYAYVASLWSGNCQTPIVLLEKHH